MYEGIKKGSLFFSLPVPSVSSHCKPKFSKPGQSGYKEKGVWSV